MKPEDVVVGREFKIKNNWGCSPGESCVECMFNQKNEKGRFIISGLCDDDTSVLFKYVSMGRERILGECNIKIEHIEYITVTDWKKRCRR